MSQTTPDDLLLFLDEKKTEEKQATDLKIIASETSTPSLLPCELLGNFHHSTQRVLPLLQKLFKGKDILNALLFPPVKYTFLHFSHQPLRLLSTSEGNILLKIEVVEHKPPAQYGKLSPRNPYRISVLTFPQNEPLTLLFFAGTSYIWKSMFKEKQEYYITGKVTTIKGGNCSMVHPTFVDKSKLLDDQIVETSYPLSAGISQFHVSGCIQSSLPALDSLKFDWNFLPEKLMSIHDAIRSIHFPSSLKQAEEARVRLAFDELLSRNLALKQAAHVSEKVKSIQIFTSRKLIKQALDVLPFTLTDDQTNALEDIISDQESTKNTTRLLQGDVGSGKSIVILLAALNAVEGGYQSAVMAPTFLLARQLFSTFEEICILLKVKIIFLSGKAKGKATIKKYISSGVSQIIVGTHSLFSEDVQFNNLGFVAIDEQHRFGVNSRIALLKKGSGVKSLFASATPIPRTLSMALFGNIRLSAINTKPPRRKEIITSMLPSKKIEEMILKLQSQVQNNAKVYWVCPAIEKTDNPDGQITVMDRYETLIKYFDPEIISIVHGKVKEQDREKEMQKFINGETKIILATTVIEVGVNVLDATIMIIEEAENFGLSTLHQLRGRVGRGEEQSYCILIYKNGSQQVFQRLSVIKRSHDGFYIAEQDMSFRGHGTLLGNEQTGFETFKFLKPYEDQEIVLMVKEVESEIEKNPDDIQYLDKTQKLLEFFKYSQNLDHINK